MEGAEALRKITSKYAELPFLTEDMLDELMHDVAVHDIDEVLNELINGDDVVNDGAVGGL